MSARASFGAGTWQFTNSDAAQAQEFVFQTTVTFVESSQSGKNSTRGRPTHGTLTNTLSAHNHIVCRQTRWSLCPQRLPFYNWITTSFTRSRLAGQTLMRRVQRRQQQQGRC